MPSCIFENKFVKVIGRQLFSARLHCTLEHLDLRLLRAAFAKRWPMPWFQIFDCKVSTAIFTLAHVTLFAPDALRFGIVRTWEMRFELQLLAYEEFGLVTVWTILVTNQLLVPAFVPRRRIIGFVFEF